MGCFLLLFLLLLFIIINVFPENLLGFSRTFRACRRMQICVPTLVRSGFLSFRVYEGYQSYTMVHSPVHFHVHFIMHSLVCSLSIALAFLLFPVAFPRKCSCTSWESFVLSEGSLIVILGVPLLVPCVVLGALPYGVRPPYLPGAFFCSWGSLVSSLCVRGTFPYAVLPSPLTSLRVKPRPNNSNM